MDRNTTFPSRSQAFADPVLKQSEVGATPPVPAKTFCIPSMRSDLNVSRSCSSAEYRSIAAGEITMLSSYGTATEACELARASSPCFHSVHAVFPSFPGFAPPRVAPSHCDAVALVLQVAVRGHGQGGCGADAWDRIEVVVVGKRLLDRDRKPPDVLVLGPRVPESVGAEQGSCVTDGRACGRRRVRSEEAAPFVQVGALDDLRGL
eukprot:1207583-Rhodomonas_salina.1